MTRRFATVILVACLCSCTPNNSPPPESGAVERFVTLAPHLTELVFAAGAGDKLVAVSAYSDHPPEAEHLPIVSDAFTVDQEQLALLKPDLLLAWASGTPRHFVDELRAAGYRVATIETRGLEDIAAALRHIGALSQRDASANAAADAFMAELGVLREEFAEVEEISVFYQISARPLYTINAEHFIGEIVGLCGGRNIFADLTDLAPSVSVEAVIDRDPDVLLAADDGSGSPFAEWQRWPSLAANRYGNHYSISASEVGRATPRLLQATAKVCAALAEARVNKERIDG